MPLLRRHLSPFTQLVPVTASPLVVGVAIFVWPAIGKNAAEQAERARQARSDAAPGGGALFIDRTAGTG